MMSFKRSILVGVLLSVVLVVPAYTEESLSDPYLILEKHFEAIGGLEDLKAQETMYKEGKITIEGAGLEGTFKQWSRQLLKLRQEIDLKVVSTIAGDNGEFSWLVDRNGKLLIRRDEITLKEREVRRLMSQYEYSDPESEYFTLALEGIEKVNGKDCYVVKITNAINQDVQIDYYDKSEFYLLRTMLIQPDNEQHVTYSDFRRVSGLVMPFKEIVKHLPIDETTTIEYSSYILNKSIDDSIFEPPAQDVEDFTFLNGESAEDIPFEFIEDHLYMPVNLAGKERLWVIDCGASVNVIDSSFAAELGLSFEGPIKGKGASGVVNLYYVTLPTYTIGGIRFEEQKVLAFSIREMFHKALGLDVVGILGYDFLSRFVTKIDYAKQEISFYHPTTFEYTGKGEIFDSPIQVNMLSLPATIDGQYSGKLRLDIGAPDIDFHYPFASKHDLLTREGVDIKVGDAAGQTTSRISQYKTIQVGNFLLKNPLIGTPQEEGTGAHAEETTIGNIGNSYLRNFILFLDYHDQRVILEKGDDYGKEIPRAKSGLQFYYNNENDIVVIFVSPGTPAHDAGFKQGDIITSVNRIGVEFFDGIIALRKLMREEASTTYSIGILRDGKLLEKKVTLRDLF
jgi:outer membrane lipoprotein-sorting protein